MHFFHSASLLTLKIASVRIHKHTYIHIYKSHKSLTAKLGKFALGVAIIYYPLKMNS